MLTDLFFATTLVFVYGTLGLVGYSLSEQCCRTTRVKYNHPNIQTYIKMRRVCGDIELFGKFRYK